MNISTKCAYSCGWYSKTLFVLNQVDKIEPFREWDIKNSQPSPAQMQNIRDKETYLTQRFGFTDHPIISVAASEGYNVTHLVEAMVRASQSTLKVVSPHRSKTNTNRSRNRRGHSGFRRNG
jgi:predicted GTPase